MPAARILIAASEGAIDQLSDLLSGYSLCTSTTLEEAMKFLLHNEFDLVICGAHFDESRALEFINFMRSDAGNKEAPCVVYQYKQTKLHEMTTKSLLAVKEALNIKSIIDLKELEHNEQTLRERLEDLIPEAKVIRNDIHNN